ncbi:tRNA pseudouridine(38-40) synthase TruA [Pontivivens ytuae]|uniref:tRNA pseudouridine synthase A n=1 Tax=Pontivivens ytuae TaxID=2789856 RepID=A0A7S9LUU2_9RHOB|nr:tRNA pseudouridine(38-40) synthase TruA [Pontivivens ytuae]QPH55155.1 tRNA pseudouridine(38-40) synthase TruA [Pontivivens ytuae]
MPRYALRIEYHGAPFAGWQRQRAHPSVQQALEEATAKLGENTTVTGAGRTDAGVHARGQVAHLDTERDWDPFRLSQAINHHMRPLPVAVTAAAQVAPDWHARFSAISRRYLYRILPRRAPAALDAGLVWQVRQEMDVDAMQEAANRLLGRHDFTTFRSTMCQALSPVKTLDALDVRREGAEVHLYVRARSFLHNQVRSFAGTLERVGAGAWTPNDVEAALDARDRARCGPVAPPDGLYLMEVGYPEDPFA